ncbi:MAG TPA: hypothetical protein VKH35_07445 [Thermoanaerobaculia bacterium]|jgi:hypothetical protein|nr:hypothetical protein [Thermoanaerobaculia bacterium]
MKRIAAILLFALLFVGGFRPMFLRLLVSRAMVHHPGLPGGLDRKPLREKEDPTPAPLRALLGRARMLTQPGQSVALDFAPPYDGWGYTWWRGSYVLSGRKVLLPGNLDANVVLHYPPPAIERRR